MTHSDANDASPRATLILLALFGILVTIGVATVVLPELGEDARESTRPDAGITP